MIANESWNLAVGIRLQQDGRELLREAVTPPDLIEPVSEAWRECVLRRGRSQVALEDLAVRLEPVFTASESDTCLGYSIELTEPGGEVGRHEFSIRSLDDVAQRAAQRLVARGDLQKGANYFYRLHAERRPAESAEVQASNGQSGSFHGESRIRPLDPMTVPLHPLLEQSRWVGPTDDARFPVFYTEAAAARAEAFARKGARSIPPTETGGVLIGPTCRCPDTGELFVVVVDVLEASEAEQTEFSLFYSSHTWARIQSLMSAMQSRPATRSFRILGQVHGHNFVPGGEAPPCEACPKLPVCSRTSVFVSEDDISWSRAVFRHQPWQLNHIYGLNARKEEVQGLFGLRDGRLLERGYRVISAFDMEGR